MFLRTRNFPCGTLSEIQWEALLPAFTLELAENENKQVIGVRAENIPFWALDSFSDKQTAQLKPGIWDVTGHSK